MLDFGGCIGPPVTFCHSGQTRQRPGAVDNAVNVFGPVLVLVRTSLSGTTVSPSTDIVPLAQVVKPVAKSFGLSAGCPLISAHLPAVLVPYDTMVMLLIEPFLDMVVRSGEGWKRNSSLGRRLSCRTSQSYKVAGISGHDCSGQHIVPYVTFYMKGNGNSKKRWSR